MEELKIVADMIQGLGSEARYAFVAYLVVKYGAILIQSAIICGMIAFVMSRLFSTIRAHSRATHIARAVAENTEYRDWDAERDLTYLACIKWVQDHK